MTKVARAPDRGNGALTTRAHVALGSNLGDSVARLDAAVSRLRDLAVPASSLVESPRYRSAPMGPSDQPDYLNSVARFDTTLDPLALLDALQAIEADAGRCRERERRWGPRTLDLDLLLYGELILDEPRLVLPHVGIGARAFVLGPLADLDPALVVPGLGPVASLLAGVDRAGLERIGSDGV